MAETAHDLQSNRMRDRHRRHGWLLKESVELWQAIGSDTRSVIENRDDVVAAGRFETAGDVHCSSGRRLLSSVLHQFCQEMGEILSSVTRNAQVFERYRHDPSIVLDLANCDTENFAQLDGWAMTIRGLGVSEYKKALCVATHSCRKMIHPIHDGESIGVALFGLEGVDRLKLTVEERLVATCKVDKRVCNAVLQLAYLDTKTTCALANRVQALRNVTKFVATDAFDMALSTKFFRYWRAGAKRVCKLGKIALGYSCGLIAKCFE